MMLTYEQVKPALYKWARHFSGRKFEFWELVNEVWVMGQVQQLPHIKLASGRVKYDMIDYMRQETHSRMYKYHQSRGNDYAKFTTFGVLLNKPDGEEFELRTQEDIFNIVDDKDYFEWLITGLSHREKLTITLRFQCGYTFAEIGEIIDVSESMALNYFHSALQIIKLRLVNAGQVPRKCNRPIPQCTSREKSEYYKRWYAKKKRLKQKRQEDNEVGGG